MNTRIILLVAFIAAIIFAPRYILGFSLWHIGDAIDVSASMGAKLSCSGKFISRFSNEQIIDDLSSYSPVNQYLDIQYDSVKKTATATLFNLSTYTAKYRPATGCSLDIGDTSHLDRIVYTKVPNIAAPWPKGHMVETLNPSKQQQLEDMLKQDNAAGLNTRALVLVKNGVIQAEAYADGIYSDTKLMGWSMGKSLTAILYGRMNKLQQTDIQQTHLFSEWQDDERQHITMQNLLQMSSGIDFDEVYAPGSNLTKMLFSETSASDIVLNEGRYGESPGKHFAYSSATTNLIMRWMYNELGNSTQNTYDFLRHELLSKMSMSNTVFETDSMGLFVGSSYIYASARDWARLGLLMLNEGHINGQQLLNKEYVQAAQQQNTSENYHAYGYQFWLNQNTDNLEYPQLPTDAYFMMGNRKQAVMIAPSEDAVIVRLGWTKGSYPMNERFSQILSFN